MGFLSTDGVRSGLDIEYCKAVAAAIGLNPTTDIEWSCFLAGQVREALRAARSTCSSAQRPGPHRDADLNADFAGINFYDGQGILIRGDLIANPGATAYTPAALDGATICVGTGTTTRGQPR